MRPLMIVLVVVALAIAGVTAFLARSFVSQPAPMAAAPVQEAPSQKVLVAARDIAPGAILVEEDLRYESWPASAVDKRFLISGPGDDAKAKALGSVAARNLLAGEPFSGNAIFRQDQASVVSAMIGPGMRAISLAITANNAVSGFVNPGDRVDIVLLTRFKDRDQNKLNRAEDELFVTEVLLRDVRVIAIDNNLKTGGVASPGRTATLEVTAREAEQLILAGVSGTIHLVLRSQIAGEGGESSGLFNNVSAVKAMQSYSDLARKMGFLAGTANAAPSDEGEAVESVSSAGRAVKVNRAGVIEIRNLTN